MINKRCQNNDRALFWRIEWRTLPNGNNMAKVCCQLYWRIADPFIVDEGRIIRLNPILETNISWAKRIISTYSDCGYTADKDQALIVALNKLDEVHLVNHLPDDLTCMMEEALPNHVLNGSKQVLIACTIKRETYIRKDLFAQLSLADQTSLLVHERLHAALSDNPPKVIDPTELHLHIFGVAGGVKTALQKMYQQQEGDRNLIGEKEYSSLLTMREGFSALGLGCGANDYAIWMNGGGLVNKNTISIDTNPKFMIDPTAFVGISSILNGRSAMNIMGCPTSISGTGAIMSEYRVVIENNPDLEYGLCTRIKRL